MKGFTEQELRELVSWLSDEAAEMMVDREFIVEARGFDFSETLKRLRSVVESWQSKPKAEPQEVFVEDLSFYRVIQCVNKLLKPVGFRLRWRTGKYDREEVRLRLESLP